MTYIITNELVEQCFIEWLSSPDGQDKLMAIGNNAIAELSQQTGETREAIIKRFLGNISS